MRPHLLSASLAAVLAVGAPLLAHVSPVCAAAGQTSAVPKKISTEQYLEKAAAGDLFEVESGKLAVQKGGSDEVKQFGRMMTEDHTRSTEKIKQTVSKTPLMNMPPALLTDRQRSTLERLSAAEGSQFDKLYIESQLEAHQEALELHRSYEATGDDAALKQTAAAIVPVVEKHLAALEKMSSAKRN